MSNPLKEIIKSTGKPAYILLEDELKGTVTQSTLYGLLADDGIPSKAQWGTVEKVAQALGYQVIFRENGVLTCPDCASLSLIHIDVIKYRCKDCGFTFGG